MLVFDGGLGGHNKKSKCNVLGEIEAYWEALRDVRDMPARSEVDPRGIEMALRHAFILERMAPGMARIRVAGSLVSDAMGMEVRGMPISALISGASRDEFRAVLEDVFHNPAKARLRLSAERGFGRPDLNAEMLLLPLRSGRGDVSRILGGMEFTGQIGSRPRRFNLTSSFLRSLRDGKELRKDQETPMFAPPASLPRTVATGTPYLRLVVNE